MVNPRRAQNGKPQKQPREGAYVDPHDLQSVLERIRQAATKNRRQRFTALWHHVYQIARLREEYFHLKRYAAPGVDNQTWQEYGENLEENLRTLSDRLQRGA